MKRKESLPELLAPAGDFDCLVAAVKGGADAVYVGAKSFGARAFAKNFELDELRRAVAYCHLNGVKLYVTLNTLLMDSELGEAYALARELYLMGVDAVIVADLGLVRLLRAGIPGLELHASTQMSVHNSLGADEAHALGLTRVVLAREVSARDIADITARCKPEIEVFLHGALCVCHSGQCLFSSLVGGRSGNRGECAQPCRLPYSNGYALSLTDLSLAGHIPELIASGVSSLKIEGRMKSPDYVYTVTSIYRRLLDEGRSATRAECERLARAFSRGGFTDGYFTGRLDKKNMLGIRSSEDKKATREDREELPNWLLTPTRVKIFASASIRRGEKSRLTITLPKGKGRAELSASAEGDIPSEAISRPLTSEDVRSRLSKMGNTLFDLSVEDISLELDGGVNLSPAAINALRRAAAEALTAMLSSPADPTGLVEGFSPDGLSTDTERVEGISSTATFHSPSVYNAVGELDGLIDLAFLPLWRMGEATREGFGVALPPVIMESELDEVRGLCAEAALRGVRYALVGNLGQLSLCREAGLIPICDFRFNLMNLHTGATLSTLGVKNCLLSPELTAPQARRMGEGVVTYGRIPLMLTERCFMSDTFGCERCSACSLTDRKGISFPMIREYRHRTLILNSAVTYMGDRADELRGTRGRHFIFTTESDGEVRAIARAYRRGEKMPLSIPFRRMGRRSVKAD